jgi:RimJ/RimL family protein N-acetyltransferase
MDAPENLQTERLNLRVPRLEDAPAIFEAWTRDPEATRYLTWKPHTQVSETEGFLERCIRVWGAGTNYPYVITFIEQDAPVGMIEIHVKGFILEVGYVLARPYWGKGLMSEALQGVIGFGLSQPEVFRLQATCDVENIASARVMEKAGMLYEGMLRRFVLHPNISNTPRDVFLYAIVR